MILAIYEVSIKNKTLMNAETGEDVSHLLKINYCELEKLMLNLDKDKIFLFKEGNRFFFAKHPTTLFDEPLIELTRSEIIDFNISKNNHKKEENKMDEKYKVFDGPDMIAEDLDLDVALCLIEGYVKRYRKRIKAGISLVPMDGEEKE